MDYLICNNCKGYTDSLNNIDECIWCEIEQDEISYGVFFNDLELCLLGDIYIFDNALYFNNKEINF